MGRRLITACLVVIALCVGYGSTRALVAVYNHVNHPTAYYVPPLPPTPGNDAFFNARTILWAAPSPALRREIQRMQQQQDASIRASLVPVCRAGKAWGSLSLADMRHICAEWHDPMGA